MRNWLISVPVWGPKYVKTFVEEAVPALRAALAGFPEPHRFLIHTNDPTRINAALAGFDVDIQPVSQKPTYIALQEGHADAVARAKIGEAVVLLNADLVVSRNMFTSCAAHLDAGDLAIVLVGIRTDPKGNEVPKGAPARELLEWAWEYRHRIIQDLEWGTGASMLPTNLFFVKGHNVVVRGFHLHPIAILKTKDIPFKSTIDGDLLDHFARERIHVVVDPDDMSMLEISEPTRRFPVGRMLNPAAVAASMRSRASPLHKWLFTHRIVIRGTGEGCGDDAISHAVLARLGGV